MGEAVLQIHVPTALLDLGWDRNEIQRRLVEGMVISLFTEGRISSGKASQILGISRVEFLALLRERGVAYIDYTPDELAEEFAAVEALDWERNGR